MDAYERLCRALLTNCPAPVETRDWDAQTPEGRAAWFRYYGAILRVQHELQEEDFRREIAEALTPTATTDPHLRWGEGRVDGLDPEERADVLAEAFARYARHLDGCAQAPCTCGLATLLSGGQDPI
jgi:hypothetical protein